VPEKIEKSLYETIKIQNPSTKLQINLKFQKPMTETYTAIGQYRSTKLALPIILPFRTKVDRSMVWDFEFGLLGFVWNLSFGIWDLMNGILEQYAR
jgi:hypothetical protein